MPQHRRRFSGSHAEFARYLAIARRSLNELCDCARAAELKRYIEPNDVRELQALARRLYPAMSALIRYLARTPDPDGRPVREHRSRQSRKRKSS